MRYTKEQLNSKVDRKKMVCRIDNIEEWYVLKSLCSNISDYEERFKHYLCPNEGRCGDVNIYDSNYIIITFSELMNLTYEIY